MKSLQKKKQDLLNITDFGAIRISLASPEQIKEWSYGEVKKPETLNYRTLKPERDGIFCEKIFGPVKDYECSCGKYKKSVTSPAQILNKQIICDRCGVEVTTSKVRRERMGHITLAVPVAHFWYFGKTPSKIAIFLDMYQNDVRKIVYGMAWVVVKNIDDIKSVVIDAIEFYKSELIKEIDTEVLNALLNEMNAPTFKIPLYKKTVLDPRDVKNIVEYLRRTVYFKNVKGIGLDEAFDYVLRYDNHKIVKKIVTDLTEKEKYVGNITDEKNYLRENVYILTNAEALYRLLKTADEELKKELEDISDKLKELSITENVSRISTLFDKYKDHLYLKEDLEKINIVFEEIKHLSKNKNLKDIKLEELIEKVEKEATYRGEYETVINKIRAELETLYKDSKLSDKVTNILYELFEKYNINIQPSPLRSRLINRYKLIENFVLNNIRPENMILTVLPVLPPDLRPLVAIEGGKFASSDLNELYRRIIHRNNRLKRFFGQQSTGEKSDKGEIYVGVPRLILLNEKRLLQEAVDALIENSAKKQPIKNSQKRPLKSLTDILKGKQGRFRQNLLGKRIDYSGRSVIVVNPDLKLYQCGLPKEMALELFKPYILHKLMTKYNVTLKKAKTILEKKSFEIWDIVEEITKHHPVLLNRAPTLHRPSIQAFEPILIEGKAIQIHPMVCTPFNADFDGDQMAVYVPLTLEALTEAKLLMMSYFNLFSPANGKPLIGATQDVVLGIAYMTTVKEGELGEGRIFGSVDEAIHNYQQGKVALNAKIKVCGVNDIFEGRSKKEAKEFLSSPSLWQDYVTVGRLLVANILPSEVIDVYYDILRKRPNIGKKELTDIVKIIFKRCGHYRTIIFLDELKKLGYHYATVSGFTISVDDMLIPKNKLEKIKSTWREVHKIEEQAKKGIITEKERYNSIIDVWSRAIEDITNEMIEEMKGTLKRKYNENEPRFNSVYFMAESGARGNIDQVKQLSAIRGLMSRPQRKISGEIGEIIETPIISSFREGLGILEYFISTHGGRKGLSDTALKTSEAGYLTRRLIDVAHHIVVTEEDCKTLRTITVSALKAGDEVIIPLRERIAGRVAADDIVYEVEDKEKNEIITKVIKAGEMITEEQAKEIEESGLYERIRIRSVLTCESENGVCAKCYGMDLSTGKLVSVGEAVGIVAAQSIGEPGTQLTLRTFHIGGATARLTKQSQFRAPGNGHVEWISESGYSQEKGKKKFKTIQRQSESGSIFYIVVTSDAIVRCVYTDPKTKQPKKVDVKLEYGSRIYVEDGAEVKEGDIIADWDIYSIPIISEKSGKAKYRDLEENKTYVVEYRTYGRPEMRVLPYRGRKNPRIDIIGEKGKILATYPLPVDSVILVKDNEDVKEGDVIAKIPKEEIKTKDITGGLPRIEELFEARHPQNPAVLSEIDGIVKFETKEKVRKIRDEEVKEIEISIKVVNEKSKKEIRYDIPTGRTPLVYNEDKVEAGEPLTDGVIDPNKYLEIRGAQHLQEFLLNEIQEVYRLQGVNINDKHLEIIIKQMLSFVRITDPGVPPKRPIKHKKFYKFIYSEVVPKKLFEAEVRKIEEERKELKKANDPDAAIVRPPKAEPILLGITLVASLSDSFLSAASFQETSRILTDAALECKIDDLSGLKENVIIGRLIPAGTGFYSEETYSLKKEGKLLEELIRS